MRRTRPTVIIVTGTPGTGKTTLAKRLAKALRYQYVDVNRVIKDEKLREGYDKKRRAVIVDEIKLARVLEKRIHTSATAMVIDSHLSHYLDPSLVNACLVTVCDLRVLERRLKKKGYNKAKINENIQAEIFETCAQEAREIGHNPIIINTTKGVALANILRLLAKKRVRIKKK